MNHSESGINNIARRADGAFLWCKKALEKEIKEFSSPEVAIKQSARKTLEMLLTNLSAMDRGTGEVNPEKKAKNDPTLIPSSLNSYNDVSKFVVSKYDSIMKSKGIDTQKDKEFAISIPEINMQSPIILAAKGRGR